MAERIKLLEQQGTKSKIDPKEVAKLEKVVGANQKGTNYCGYLLLLCAQQILTCIAI